MTINPATLKALGSYWTGQGGVNLGVVGDTAHQAKGWSYHLGKDDLAAGASSARTARDKAGLSNAASAIDLGKLDGKFSHLRAFSSWLVGQARANAPGTSDIREIIFSPDGVKVLQWDRERGHKTAPIQAGDDSHLTHTHVSFYRDAEKRDHTTAFRPYFETAAGGDMPPLTSYTPGQVAKVKATANIRTEPKLSATILRVVPAAGETWSGAGAATGWVKGDVDPEGGSDQWLTRWNAGKWEYTAKSNVTSLTPPAVGPAPAPDCAAAVKAATDPLNAAITELRTDVADAELAGARKEWDRQAAGSTVSVKLLDRP